MPLLGKICTLSSIALSVILARWFRVFQRIPVIDSSPGSASCIRRESEEYDDDDGDDDDNDVTDADDYNEEDDEDVYSKSTAELLLMYLIRFCGIGIVLLSHTNLLVTSMLLLIITQFDWLEYAYRRLWMWIMSSSSFRKVILMNFMFLVMFSITITPLYSC